MTLRTEYQAEYQRQYRFAEKVGDTLENVRARIECVPCDCRFPRFDYTPIRYCAGKGSGTLWYRSAKRCPQCGERPNPQVSA